MDCKNIPRTVEVPEARRVRGGKNFRATKEKEHYLQKSTSYA
jgi:hypothetical protein